QLHHGAQVRRDDRDGVQDHALRRVVRREERVDDLEALERTGLPLSLAGLDELAQHLGLGRQVEVAQALLDRGGTHRAREVQAEAGDHVAVERLVALQIGDLERLEAVPDLLDAVDLAVRGLPEIAHLLLRLRLDLPLRGSGRAVGLEGLEVLLELLGTAVDVRVTTGLDALLLHVDLVLQRGQIPVARLLVDRGDHVRREVDDLLEVLGRQVQQVAQAGRHTLEVPDVGDRSGELDVAHALAAHLGAGHLDTAALADDALEADALVLAARALPVTGGTEDALAEEPVLLRLQGAVVDGLRLLDLTVRPTADVVGRGQADAQFIKEIDVRHVNPSLFHGDRGSPHHSFGGSDFFDGVGLVARQIDAQLLRSAEDLLIRIAHLDLHAVRRQHLDVQ